MAVEICLLGIGLTAADYIVLAVSFVIILTVSIIKNKRGHVISDNAFTLRYSLLALLFTAIIVFGAYGTGYDMTQFIYNQF